MEVAGSRSLLCEILGLALISSILWWNFCAGAYWEGTAPFVSCLSSVSRCLVFFKAWCNTPSLFTVAQSGNRDCFVLFFALWMHKRFSQLPSFVKSEEGDFYTKTEWFFNISFLRVFRRVIQSAVCALSVWWWGDRLEGQAKNKKRHCIESLILKTAELPLKCYNQWDDSCTSHQMFNEWNDDIFRSFSS